MEICHPARFPTKVSLNSAFLACHLCMVRVLLISCLPGALAVPGCLVKIKSVMASDEWLHFALFGWADVTIMYKSFVTVSLFSLFSQEREGHAWESPVVSFHALIEEFTHQCLYTIIMSTSCSHFSHFVARKHY